MTVLSEQQARDLIAPWYALFNVATRGDVRAVQEAVLTDDYESCAGYLPGECWGRENLYQGGVELRRHDPGYDLRH